MPFDFPFLYEKKQKELPPQQLPLYQELEMPPPPGPQAPHPEPKDDVDRGIIIIQL